MARPATLVSVISHIQELCGLKQWFSEIGPQQQHPLPLGACKKCTVSASGPAPRDQNSRPLPWAQPCARWWQEEDCASFPNLKAAALSLCCSCSSTAGTT